MILKTMAHTSFFSYDFFFKRYWKISVYVYSLYCLITTRHNDKDFKISQYNSIIFAECVGYNEE